MMRVRILSGVRAGRIEDLPPVEAEVAFQTGYAEPAPDDSATTPLTQWPAEAAPPSAPTDAPSSGPPETPPPEG